MRQQEEEDTFRQRSKTCQSLCIVTSLKKELQLRGFEERKYY